MLTFKEIQTATLQNHQTDSPILGRRLMPGVDVRDAAYVIAAGSVMGSGHAYWLLEGTVLHLTAAILQETIPELPAGLASMMASLTSIPDPRSQTKLEKKQSGISARRLAGLVRKVATAPSGERNHTTYWMACRMGQLVVAGEFSKECAIAMIVEAGVQSGLSVREVEATARSAIEKTLRPYAREL